MVREVKLDDAKQITEIYSYYVLNTAISFQKEPPTVLETQKKIQQITSKYPWYVFEEKGLLLGYAYANAWKERFAYHKAVEVSIYLKNGSSGKGIGSLLYGKLFNELEIIGFHSLIGGVALPNDASIALHEKFGFEKIAHFKEVGFKFGKWVDVAYWQKLI